jgi:hypothetical protein
MTKKQAIKESIAHWKRMINWVKKRPRNWRPCDESMSLELGEDWFSASCPLCEIRADNNSCVKCPLYKKYGTCLDNDNINAWCKVSDSETKQEWLKYAKIMLGQLRSLL